MRIAVHRLTECALRPAARGRHTSLRPLGYRSPITARPARGTQAGLTLVDLLLGMALGLFLCATAGGLMLSQLREHKHLLAETLLQQDLRNAMSLMQLEIRRAGAELEAHELVPEPGIEARAPRAAPLLEVLLDGAPVPPATPGDGLLLSFDRVEADAGKRRVDRGFRLRQGQLQYLLERSWQPWNNGNTVRFTHLLVRLDRHSLAPAACACPDGAAPCIAGLQGQLVDVVLTGQSLLDASAVRSLHSTVHVRNDHLELTPSSC